MATVEEFEAAAARVQKLPKTPSNDDLLELYALFKQATVGDATGKRPGLLDVRGRAKFDAWERRRGMSAEGARAAYVAVVARLERK
ncbi:MAG: acyl-CoA-binding protein [Sandaracinaceae bacterium]|nr:acyl-CoA-binding protein [Sandaracinaceae bacterium]